MRHQVRHLAPERASYVSENLAQTRSDASLSQTTKIHVNTAADAANPYAHLELIDAGVKLVSLTFGINLYSNLSFYAQAQQVLQTFDLFLQHCPAEQLAFYATETMKQHKPVTARVLGMPGLWLAPGAAHKHYIALELKAAASSQDAAAAKYELWSADASRQANIVSLALPADSVGDRPDEMLAFVVQLANLFSFRSGCAGYSFECSRYDKEKSETHAWSNSMRHPGIDIVRIPFDAKAVGDEGIKGVNWLTLIDTGLLKDLGGVKSLRQRLSSEIEIIDCTHGIILKAGASPALGDISHGDTLPLYRQVYDLLAPWIALAADDSMAFRLGKDAIGRTEAWCRRFGA